MRDLFLWSGTWCPDVLAAVVAAVALEGPRTRVHILLAFPSFPSFVAFVKKQLWRLLVENRDSITYWHHFYQHLTHPSKGVRQTITTLSIIVF